MLTVVLKRNKDKPIRMGHPWVFSGAIARVEGDEAAGAACRVVDSDGTVVGHGHFNPSASIAVRVLTRADRPFDDGQMAWRIRRAAACRSGILDESTDACRVINSEGDFLPGLIVDRYAGGLCLQILTAGMERMRETVLSVLAEQFSPSFVFERSDTESRQREGLAPRVGLLMGSIPDSLTVRESGLIFSADLQGGQKTGMFLDQRENRRLVRQYAAGKSVLDCFCYTGAFSVYALSGGAVRARCVDSSRPALDSARLNRRNNGFDAPAQDFVHDDVFRFLRRDTDFYSMVILDPPKFAKQNREVDAACRGYKDINLVAMRRIESGGLLFTFSCSQAVEPRLFRQVVFAAAADSGRDVQIMRVLSQGPDHPVNIAHREGEYLKGLALRVM